MTRHFLSLLDLSANELQDLLRTAATLKTQRGTASHPAPLEGKSVALIFEKASTRTRMSFEVGVRELGGHPLVVAARDTQLGRGEPLSDTARMLSGYVHAVVYRTHGHERLEALRDNSTVPIVNGLSDRFHPCQLLADLQTLQEEFDHLQGLKVAWVGDGNNMAHSWILAAARTGIELRIAAPDGYKPLAEIVAEGERLGARLLLTDDPQEACRGANVVTTDVWTSMGQEAENEVRRSVFSKYCVNETLMSEASRDAVFLHCLPAHRGEEVTTAVLEGDQSRVWQQAENRLHAQKALLSALIADQTRSTI